MGLEEEVVVSLRYSLCKSPHFLDVRWMILRSALISYSDSRQVSITFNVGAHLTSDGIRVNHHVMATPDNVDLDSRTRLQYRTLRS